MWQKDSKPQLEFSDIRKSKTQASEEKADQFYSLCLLLSTSYLASALFYKTGLINELICHHDMKFRVARFIWWILEDIQFGNGMKNAIFLGKFKASLHKQIKTFWHY